MLEKDLKISQKERKEILKQLGLPLSLAGIEQKREKAILDFYKNSKDIKNQGKKDPYGLAEKGQKSALNRKNAEAQLEKLNKELENASKKLEGINQKIEDIREKLDNLGKTDSGSPKSLEDIDTVQLAKLQSELKLAQKQKTVIELSVKPDKKVDKEVKKAEKFYAKYKIDKELSTSKEKKKDDVAERIADYKSQLEELKNGKLPAKPKYQTEKMQNIYSELAKYREEYKAKATEKKEIHTYVEGLKSIKSSLAKEQINLNQNKENLCKTELAEINLRINDKKEEYIFELENEIAKLENKLEKLNKNNADIKIKGFFKKMFRKNN